MPHWYKMIIARKTEKTSHLEHWNMMPKYYANFIIWQIFNDIFLFTNPISGIVSSYDMEIELNLWKWYRIVKWLCVHARAPARKTTIQIHQNCLVDVWNFHWGFTLASSCIQANGIYLGQRTDLTSIFPWRFYSTRLSLSCSPTLSI